MDKDLPTVGPDELGPALCLFSVCVCARVCAVGSNKRYSLVVLKQQPFGIPFKNIINIT